MSVNLVKRHEKKTERRREHSVQSALLEAMRHYNDSRLSIQDLLFVSIHTNTEGYKKCTHFKENSINAQEQIGSPYITIDNNRNVIVYCFRDFI